MSDTAVLVVDNDEHLSASRRRGIDTQCRENHRSPGRTGPSRARIGGVDLVHVNDNYGDFTAEFSDLVRSACDGERPDLVEPIVPADGNRTMIDAELGAAAIRMMEANMSAELTSAADCLG
jgi:hypothetical protein